MMRAAPARLLSLLFKYRRGFGGSKPPTVLSATGGSVLG